MINSTMFIIYPNAKNFPFWVLLFKTISSSPVMFEVNWSKQTNACTLYEHLGQKAIANVR